ncbi:hypothetical protein [Yinghuangia seranimata]|uniref:hypothetical protein n=1 Tax=Yinghuangia seranimata TaxID=408067 RepID=UPI00248B3A04|nr:hypothetical protein [Yinghuangia seranimata]MDI2128497.1 hypothetical protein [Yinghuangia seranimata]
MSVGDKQLCRLVRRLLDERPRGREEAAEVVCDWLRAFNEREVGLVVALLASIAAVEDDPDAREAQLHAMTELSIRPGFDRAQVAPVYGIDRAVLGPGELEYIDGFEEE